MRTFRVYFKDGNQKLYQAVGIDVILKYLRTSYTCRQQGYTVEDIVRIEVVDNEEEEM